MAHAILDKFSRPAGPAGVYLHIPFCSRKCPYCDFYSVADLSLTDAFITALRREMRCYAEYALSVDTLYAGGGTPSVLKPAAIADILAEARRCFNILPGAELTLEVNPGTVSAGSLSAYRRCGVNRVNIGVQSFQDGNLKFLRRIHSAADAADSIKWARRAGFSNIGIDLIYGVPGQTRASWLADLEQAVAFRPEHLSCYMLTYEKGTPMERRRQQRRFSPLPEERVAELFIETAEWLGESGYVQYEISNFTLAGPDGSGLYPSRHNQKYWTFAPYLGLGPAAHSYLEPIRFWNPRSVESYIVRLGAGRPATEDSEVLTAQQQMVEAIFLGLRTAEGICLDRFNDKFKLNFLELFHVVLPELEEAGLFKVEKNRCVLSREGMLLLDSIADRMIGVLK